MTALCAVVSMMAERSLGLASVVISGWASEKTLE